MKTISPTDLSQLLLSSDNTNEESSARVIRALAQAPWEVFAQTGVADSFAVTDALVLHLPHHFRAITPSSLLLNDYQGDMLALLNKSWPRVRDIVIEEVCYESVGVFFTLCFQLTHCMKAGDIAADEVQKTTEDCAAFARELCTQTSALPIAVLRLLHSAACTATTAHHFFKQLAKTRTGDNESVRTLSTFAKR